MINLQAFMDSGLFKDAVPTAEVFGGEIIYVSDERCMG
jgi:hypothetical protein